MDERYMRLKRRRSQQRNSLVAAIAFPTLFHVSLLMLLTSLLLFAGCETTPQETAPPPSKPATEVPEVAGRRQTVTEPSVPAPLVAGFTPVAVSILPLTELSQPEGDRGRHLSVYVSLLDTFSSQMKAPGTFRIELYDYVQRSAEPKGPRIKMWSDLDLTAPAENQKYWRDFLRAYEFVVPTDISPEKAYVLEVTCLIPSGRRLSDEWILRPGE
jgi:hypothetical protein